MSSSLPALHILFHRHHLMEITINRVVSHILMEADNSSVYSLLLIWWITLFQVNHNISGLACTWFESYFQILEDCDSEKTTSLLLLLLLVFITRYLHPSCLATLEWIWSARQCTSNNLPTVIIRVPFSSKGVNHMAYLAHVTTVVWCVLLFV